MDRIESIFEADNILLSKVDAGIAEDGSNLGHVTAICKWMDMKAMYAVTVSWSFKISFFQPVCGSYISKNA